MHLQPAPVGIHERRTMRAMRGDAMIPVTRFIALLLLSSAAHADEPNGAYVNETIIGNPQPGAWMGSPTTHSLTFSKDMQTMVTIKADGTVVYGEGYKPDDIAKALWDAVGVERKARNCQ